MTSKIEDIMTNSFMFVLLCPFIACIFALPIYELCIALIYKNDITTCSTTIPGLDISTWLIVKAVVTICALIAVVPCLLIDKIKFAGQVVLGLFNLFIFIWLIIGSVIFFKDCNNLKPEIVNVSMWIIIILGFLQILCSKGAYDEKKQKKALLDI